MADSPLDETTRPTIEDVIKWDITLAQQHIQNGERRKALELLAETQNLSKLYPYSRNLRLEHYQAFGLRVQLGMAIVRDAVQEAEGDRHKKSTLYDFDNYLAYPYGQLDLLWTHPEVPPLFEEGLKFYAEFNLPFCISTLNKMFENNHSFMRSNLDIVETGYLTVLPFINALDLQDERQRDTAHYLIGTILKPEKIPVDFSPGLGKALATFALQVGHEFSKMPSSNQEGKPHFGSYRVDTERALISFARAYSYALNLDQKTLAQKAQQRFTTLRERLPSLIKRKIDLGAFDLARGMTEIITYRDHKIKPVSSVPDFVQSLFYAEKQMTRQRPISKLAATRAESVMSRIANIIGQNMHFKSACV